MASGGDVAQRGDQPLRGRGLEHEAAGADAHRLGQRRLVEDARVEDDRRIGVLADELFDEPERVLLAEVNIDQRHVVAAACKQGAGLVDLAGDPGYLQPFAAEQKLDALADTEVILDHDYCELLIIHVGRPNSCY